MESTKTAHGSKQGKQKYIFVTGGVLSGVGKGITAASIGAVLQAKGSYVSIQKCDPYLNVDAGLLNPAEHGECFVTKDGAETDLDLGHYERFLDIELTQKNASLAGKIISELIASERAGKLRGKTVQLVPHFTYAIQDKIVDAAFVGDRPSNVHIVEIGGTVGDYEGLAFVEAIRELAARVGRENCMFIHVVYVPFIGTSKEFKTKPAQNAMHDLRSFGIFPDAVIVRTEHEAPESVARKISLLSGVPEKYVVGMPNVDTVYRIPETIARSPLHDLLSEFSQNDAVPELGKWSKLIEAVNGVPKQQIRVGLVAKYMDNDDTYLSVTEAIKAAGWDQNVGVDIRWINAEDCGDKDFEAVDALVVPGGFGERGVEGKIAAANYALEHKKPYLGLCLGLQVSVIAAARRAGLKDANSTEFDPSSKHDVVYIMDGQQGKESTGGTLRLGDYQAHLHKGTLAAQTYHANEIVERHRHRYEVNQKFKNDIEKGGLIISGTSPDGKLVEFVEAIDHPYFLATQAHPEFKSRPFKAHPMFVELVRSVAADA